MRRIQAYLEASFPDEKISKAIYAALEPEVKHKPDTHRSIAKIYGAKGNIRIDIEAEDLSALRATLNAYLYLLFAASNTIDAVRKISKKAKCMEADIVG